MKAVINKSRANGTAFAPPSKSFSHRALICGAFTEKSEIKNIVLSGDVLATLNCLKTLGAEAFFENKRVIIGGLKKETVKEDCVLDCFESGSTLRFLIPVILTFNKRITFTGSKSLFLRPLDEYETLCKKHGFLYEKKENRLTLCGNLKSGNYEISGEISSQFISGLMFALSLVNGDSKITVKDIKSKPYVDMTAQVINDFGGKAVVKNGVIEINGKGFNNNDYCIEGDCSNGAYLEAFKFLGGNVQVEGLNKNTVQGDIVYKKFFCDLASNKKEFDLSDCPDLAPVMFSLACLYKGAVFTGVDNLKYKESDRISSMKEELSKFGAELVYENSKVTVICKELKKPDKSLCSHNDHRVVMALALLCAIKGGEIENAEAVDKSFPDFFGILKNLGVEVLLYGDKE